MRSRRCGMRASARTPTGWLVRAYRAAVGLALPPCRAAGLSTHPPRAAAALRKIKLEINIIITIIDINLDEIKARLPMAESWFGKLSDEDVAFIKRFILASGSLKELAGSYGISYPTVRLRLDRLIEKVKVLDSREIVSEFERTLRTHYAEGRLELDTLKRLLAAHEAELAKTSQLGIR